MFVLTVAPCARAPITGFYGRARHLCFAPDGGGAAHLSRPPLALWAIEPGASRQRPGPMHIWAYGGGTRRAAVDAARGGVGVAEGVRRIFSPPLGGGVYLGICRVEE